MPRELAHGVYVETGYEGGNVGLILTRRGALLVDTPMLPPDGRRWLLAMRGLGVESVYGIVNTDYHPEHFLGNALFMPAVTFGHELAARPIARYETSTLEQVSSLYREEDPALADEIARIEIHSPELRVDDRLTLHLGGRRVEVMYLNGHTPASLGVYLPEERVLFAGDNIVNNEHPAMYQANSLAWLDTLERIREMDVETIVPGTGQPCGVEVIGPLADYIVEMRRRVEELFERGASRRECVEKVGMLEYFPVPEAQAVRVRQRRRESVERVYTEIRLAHRGR